MRIKISSDDKEEIMKIGRIVKSGGVIVYPTDTVYGIGGDPLREDVVARVKEIKGRGEKAMPILVSSLEKAMDIAIFGGLSKELAEEFWPGSLTIVLRTKINFPRSLTAGEDSIGIRMPNHDLALKIIEASGGVLIGTSANISGMPPIKSVEELDKRIEEKVDLVIDGGIVKLGVPSTVIKVESEDERRIRIIRRGAIGIEEFTKRGILIEGI
ncbi:MAG: L-threonylcarbamoyladenylate synthase [Candidatus Methanomethyliaceae archaeon]|nr:L-threonylcarbamoyladenylate synthase [Candidatus Methanomethyliaceae archaeon]MDW7971514.1 L-threonylcarbamoyladenylate synthase [Nitrososphaerota archaeon]